MPVITSPFYSEYGFNTALGVLGGSSLTIDDTPPLSPQSGQLWFNSVTGKIYLWYVDTLGGQWIQPSSDPITEIAPEYELSTATVDQYGGVIIDTQSISIDGNGIISAIQTVSFNNPELLGIATIYLPSSTLNSIVGATGTVVHDVGSLGTSYYYSSVISNFTANFTNVSLTNNQSTTINLSIDQDIIAYIPNAVQINGIPQTVNWLNNIVPIGTPNTLDIFSFTLIRISGSWIVVGNSTSGGV